MTREEWLGVAKLLNEAYEFNGKAMFESPEKVQFWFSCLQDLDYKVVCVAVKKLAMTSPSRPTIADIRNACGEIASPEPQMSEAMAWDLVRNALRDSSYHAEEQFEKLPQIVKRAVVSPDRLREWCMLSSDTVTSVVRAEFRRSYEQAVNSTKEERQLGDAGRTLLESVTRNLAIGQKG